MYSVLLDENNYFTGSYTEIGSVENGINVDSLPMDMTKPTCYYLDNNEWVFDSDKCEQLEHERRVADIRTQRDAAFSLIDKYQLTLIYESLTDEQKEELAMYRKAWLNAPETLVIPNNPVWMV